MLSSLFGDLSALKERERKALSAADEGFAATTSPEDIAPPSLFNVHAQMDDPHAQTLFVTGSPAMAIREHFRSTRADLGQSNQMITLVDVSRTRAGPLLKALSAATRAPLERLHLREQATLRSVALIERATVRRRDGDTLKIYHADTRDGNGAEEAEVRAALMERSQLSAVLLDGVSAAAADHTLELMLAAVRHSTWRCPMLAFLLPADASALAARIGAMPWPPQVRVEVLCEPMRNSSALWNSLLTLWERRRDEPVHVAQAVAPDADGLDAVLASRLLAQLLHGDGVRACALVDGAAGTLLASDLSAPAEKAPDLHRAALACSLSLRAQQHAARTMGWPAVEEFSVMGGDHQHIVRTIAARPGLFLLAVLDRHRANSALVRFRMREAERALG